MRVTKWVDLGQEVEIEIGADDIRLALAEAFANVTNDRLGEEGPNRAEIAYTLNSIGAYLKAMTAEHIALLTSAQRETIKLFLTEQAKRYEESK